MSETYTTEKFIALARKVHGDTYDYSKVVYSTAHGKVTILCRKHGEFAQKACSHLRGQGCRLCGQPRQAEIKRRQAAAKFEEEASQKHGGVYDYSKVLYADSKTPVIIVCKTHGEFSVTPNAHLKGNGTGGCKLCAFEKRGAIHKTLKTKTVEKFILDAREVHGDRYTYSEVNYLGSFLPVAIGCKDHGLFHQKPHVHLSGHGCPTCATQGTRSNTEDFITAARARHGERFDYSLVAYVKSTTPVKIICLVHGIFEQEPNSHLQNGGCKRCGIEARSEATTKDTKFFIDKAKEVHGDRYDYAKSDYLGATTTIEIGCKIHGSFWQQPNTHYKGHGCPKCAASQSKGEVEVAAWLAEAGVVVETRNREIIPPQELDLVLPDLGVAIEYCGLYWHRTSNAARDLQNSRKTSHYHLDKLLACEAAGYKLITIFEDEWLDSPEKCTRVLSRLLRLTEPRKVGARSCLLVKLDPRTATAFTGAHHLHGPAPATYHFGLEYDGAIVSSASFSAHRAIYGGSGSPGEFELVRYTQDPHYLVHGGLSKLCKALFSTVTGAVCITTFVDRRWFTGTSYLAAGFQLTGVTKPNFWYVKGKTRYNRYAFAKHKLAKRLPIFDPSLSGNENMALNGYFTIHDCGSLKLRLTRG